MIFAVTFLILSC